MKWIKVEDGPPITKGIYNVLVSGLQFDKCSTFGYWNGEDWERVQEASAYQSFEPCFHDYDLRVTHWAIRPEPPEES